MPIQSPVPYIYKRKLYLSDTDASGIAYHSKFLDWMEAARVEFLTAAYKPQTQVIAEDQVTFMPIRVEIDYKSPLLFEDTVEISVFVKSLEKVRILLGYTLTKAVDQKTILVANAMVEIVCVDASTKRPQRVPEKIASAIANWQK